jgi:N-methylhydantoinase A/oxoprolinase/acetone carboxylase beta subunit
MSEYSLGIDIGGTFTDLVIHDHGSCAAPLIAYGFEAARQKRFIGEAERRGTATNVDLMVLEVIDLQ